MGSSAAAADALLIDFRFSPVQHQTAFCFPDDPHKSLVDEEGKLLYGYDAAAGTNFFPLEVGFALHGMTAPKVVNQHLESPSVPIVITRLDYNDVSMLLTTFATDQPSEGRVDNVLVEVNAHGPVPVDFEPCLVFDAAEDLNFKEQDGTLTVIRRRSGSMLVVGRVLGKQSESGPRAASLEKENECGRRLILHRGQASNVTSYRAFFRFPQEGKNSVQVAAGLSDPESCLKSCRTFWNAWSAFQSPVAWKVPGRKGEFVQACARNIVQAREMRQGRLTFQVGPTCYRGLWVVDGNFLLEAARYMGLDKEAIEGLRTTWARQLNTGQVVASGGREHWKDTAIAIFTLVRQCELSQDWALLRELEPEVVHAIEFLQSLRSEAVEQKSALGGYGLLARGFADGGIGGVRDEFTNTLWVLAGLKALAEAAENQQIEKLKQVRPFYAQLNAAFLAAAKKEMRRHEAGFEYLPMLLKNDPDWELPDEWDRPRPQSAQWALSHAIFPGRVLDPAHPIVAGHARLMQAVAREGIPAETGWLPHNSVWNYNAAFVAEVFLWLGMRQAAHDTFTGFLNHASPQYCWREEQPLQTALVGRYIGDMPHNWASAECIRFVRHMFALEDGTHLRLLAGVTGAELDLGKEHNLTATPTRFGRLNLRFEPMDRGYSWHLAFEREAGPAPQKLSLPASLGGRLHFSSVEGASSRVESDQVVIDPAASRWTADWKS